MNYEKVNPRDDIPRIPKPFVSKERQLSIMCRQFGLDPEILDKLMDNSSDRVETSLLPEDAVVIQFVLKGRHLVAV